eukprot:TRINITY_DN5457_c0_g1_i3.p1 TRINITY_DN5457_c0_g1~~TRINITY_DN5457_c0_g1_i3.p1  ORF type:complete len:201 (-),score=43.47 TRINITY_DN5457_c0_g1_i3:342-944(-)
MDRLADEDRSRLSFSTDMLIGNTNIEIKDNLDALFAEFDQAANFDEEKQKKSMEEISKIKTSLEEKELDNQPLLDFQKQLDDIEKDLMFEWDFIETALSSFQSESASDLPHSDKQIGQSQWKVATLSEKVVEEKRMSKVAALDELLLDPDLQLVRLLCSLVQMTEGERVAAALVKIFEYHGRAVQLIKSLIKLEIDNANV